MEEIRIHITQVTYRVLHGCSRVARAWRIGPDIFIFVLGPLDHMVCVEHRADMVVGNSTLTML